MPGGGGGDIPGGGGAPPGGGGAIDGGGGADAMPFGSPPGGAEPGGMLEGLAGAELLRTGLLVDLFIADVVVVAPRAPVAIEPPSRRMRRISFSLAPPLRESKNQPIQTSRSDDGQQNQ